MLSVTALSPFRYTNKFNKVSYWWPANEERIFDPSNKVELEEFKYITSHEFPYKDYIIYEASNIPKALLDSQSPPSFLQPAEEPEENPYIAQSRPDLRQADYNQKEIALKESNKEETNPEVKEEEVPKQEPKRHSIDNDSSEDVSKPEEDNSTEITNDEPKSEINEDVETQRQKREEELTATHYSKLKELVETTEKYNFEYTTKGDAISKILDIDFA